MVYDDVIRVACLKTAPYPRGPRAAGDGGRGGIVATTEFMHPRMAEFLGLLPPRLGRALERRDAADRLARPHAVRPAAHPDRHGSAAS